MRIQRLFFLFVLLLPSVSRADTTTGLIGWWKFNDGSGTSAVDSSGNGNTGTLHGNPVWTSVCHFAGCLTFAAASSQYVDNTALSTSTTTNFTVSLWANVTSNSGSWNGFAAGTTGDSNDYQTGFNLDLGNSSSSSVNFINFECPGPSGSNGTQNLLVTSYPFGTWIHVVVVTPDAGTGDVTLYLNGVAQSHRSVACGSMSISHVLIGARDFGGGGPTSFFNGSIDDVRIYNRALSAADIAALYAGGVHIGSGGGSSVLKGFHTSN